MEKDFYDQCKTIQKRSTVLPKTLGRGANQRMVQDFSLSTKINGSSITLINDMNRCHIVCKICDFFDLYWTSDEDNALIGIKKETIAFLFGIVLYECTKAQLALDDSSFVETFISNVKYSNIEGHISILKSIYPGCLPEIEWIKYHLSEKLSNDFLTHANDESFQWTFHGCSYEAYQGIVQKGFIIGGTNNIKIKHGAAYGAGIYTSQSPIDCMVYGEYIIASKVANLPENRKMKCPERWIIISPGHEKNILPVYCLKIRQPKNYLQDPFISIHNIEEIKN